MRSNFFRFICISNKFFNMFIRYKIIEKIEILSKSCIALLKLTHCDFQIKQNLFLYIYNAIFLSVISLGFSLQPSKQPLLLLYFLWNDWILVDVSVFFLCFSSRIKVKNSSIYFSPVEFCNAFWRTYITCTNITIITCIFNDVLFKIRSSTVSRFVYFVIFGCLKFINPSFKNSNLSIVINIYGIKISFKIINTHESNICVLFYFTNQHGSNPFKITSGT